MRLFFKKVNKNRGFTLVETLIAISIFSVSVVSMMSVLGNGISDTNYAKKKIIAGYLAQEGIEYIRNMRDTYILYTTVPGNSWNGFKAKLNPCNPTNECRFDTVFSHDVSVCNNPNDCKLYVSNGSYTTNTSGTDSGFTRKIWMTTVGADEVKIYSAVSWVQGSGPVSITFSEDLFNWVE